MRRGGEGPSSPRALFRDLPRDPDLPFLWAHQDRVLERYENEQLETADLALELPTGTGKTLIGLLIAEWRRQRRGERALYLCPTRQLAHQVGAQAARYGINAQVCLTPGYDGLTAWQSGDAVAISTYAALFNYRPRFTAPQTLILDDAHAAENYVADHWTVTVDREEMPDCYQRLAALLAPQLDPRIASIMTDESGFVDHGFVDVLPLPRWWPLAGEIREILDAAVDGTDEWYAWRSHVSDGLAACNVLVSWQDIVIRPLVPATSRQPEFAEASQRVYMSATLGAGGELERIFGVRQIARLPVPEEWEEHSTGRRLFLLPGASLSAGEVDEVVTSAIETAGRALVLAPTKQAVSRRRDSLSDAGILTLDAGDIEESLEPFTTQERAALVLANRYDGIDLPGDDCRLLIVDGLPVAVNQLERFLYQRLAVTGLLGERVRTRLTQGVGRATRGEGDWCAVLVGSRDAYDFCSRGEIRELLHPELQGELRFGLEQSEDRGPEDFVQLLEVLLEHGEAWREADGEVRELRDEATRATDPAAAALQRAVAREIDFTYAMWDGDFPRAVQCAGEVADALNGNDVAAYRAWWLYQGGAAAWMANTEFEMDEMLALAREHFRRAIATGHSVHWFAELAYGDLGDEETVPDVDLTDLEVAERLQGQLRSIGFFGPGLRDRGEALDERLQAEDATPWEEGVTQIGRLLGFDATHPGGQNDPDSVWVASKDLAIVWEVKSEESADGEIGARAVQQAAGHEAWARENCPISEDATVLAVLVSARRRLGDGADVHAASVSLVSLDEVRELATQTLATLRRVRSLGRSADDAALRTKILEELGLAELLPSQLQDRFSSQALADLA